MNSNPTQQTVETRNLLFTIGGLVVVMLFLTIFIEKRSVTIPPRVVLPPQEFKQPNVVAQASLIPETTVNIKPLVTNFPPLPDFSSYKRVSKRKAAFIDYLTPIIQYQNEKILRDRDHLEQILKVIVNGETLSDAERNWLGRVAEKYEVEWKEDDLASVVIKLSRRVDIIPVSLALVQAAKESSWGRSRYAVEVNNLFGQWCFEEGCGVVPAERSPEAAHEVRSFRTVTEATRSYIHNLNTHPQYTVLRQIRQHLRIHHKPMTGYALADGLLYYSERRHAYVEEVKSMIQQYRLFQKRRKG